MTQLDSTWPIWTPCWSPDDQMIAFSAIVHGASGIAKIFTVSSTGGAIKQITPDSFTIQGCDWSPDGGSLAFDAPSPGKQGIGIWCIHLSDGTIKQLTQGPFYDGWPKYSLDGKRITFESSRGQPQQVWSCLTDGSGLEQITKGGGDFPSWSPDGEWIVFCSNRHGDYDIFVVPSEGGTEIRITDSPNHEVRPAWSPDGETICFDTNPYPSEQGVWTIAISNLNFAK